MTNTENGLRVPLIIYSPRTQRAKGLKISALAEAVDIYKTLAELSGVGLGAVEEGVDGVSLAQLVNSATPNDARSTPPPRTVARSQFPRCYTQLNNASANAPGTLPVLDRTDCQAVYKEAFDLMGYSIRTAEWRLTEWRTWDGAALKGRWDLPPNATELYDHRGAGASVSASAAAESAAADPFATELANVAAAPANAAILKTLRAQLHETFVLSRA
jgi:arylsulfatase A-like enzyme